MSENNAGVIATIRRHAEAHRALAGSDAYSEQEAPRLEAALAAVAELIEAAKDVRITTGGVSAGAKEASRARKARFLAALARVQGVAA